MLLEAGLMRRPVLPPLFTPVPAPHGVGAFAAACALAAPEQAGSFVYGLDPGTFGMAVVLAPDEPLAEARRAFLVGMVALAEAIGAHAPPEKSLRFVWPDEIRFNEARIGGGRLVWPEACAEDGVPDWLVFGVDLIASGTEAREPGLTPDSTSLAEEDIAREDPAALAESFARYLMKRIESWAEDGFAAQGADFSRYLTDAAPSSHGGPLDSPSAACASPLPAGRGEGRDDHVVGASSGCDGEGVPTDEAHAEQPPHPRLPPRRAPRQGGDTALSPQAGRGVCAPDASPQAAGEITLDRLRAALGTPTWLDPETGTVRP